MKKNEIESLVHPLIPKITQCCNDHNAPVKSVKCCGATSTRQQTRGIQGTVTVILDDKQPGWRAKDNQMGRWTLKQSLRTILKDLSHQFDVKIQASYSCLSVNGEIITRYNDTGEVIGVLT